jgi:hypothetical protein
MRALSSLTLLRSLMAIRQSLKKAVLVFLVVKRPV